jgi:hypothetical protein
VIGRVQRKGQTKEVTVVWLLADGTTDTLLYQFAQGKARQSDAFLSKAKGMCSSKLIHESILIITLETAFLGCGSEDSEDSDDEQPDSELGATQPPVTKAKLPSKRKRTDDNVGQEKKQKKKGAPKKKATGSLNEPSSLPVTHPNVPSPTSSGEVQRDLGATFTDNDELDLFGDTVMQEDSNSFIQSRAASQYPDGTTSSATSRHITPFSSCHNSPGPSSIALPPLAPPNETSASTSGPSTSSSSLQPRMHRLQVISTESDDCTTAIKSTPQSSSSSHRTTIHRLQALPEDSDDDDDLIPPAYTQI